MTRGTGDGTVNGPDMKEKLLSAAIIIIAGVPAALYFDDPLYGGLAGIVAVTVYNVVWWRVINRTPLSEVYDVGL